MRAHVSPAFLVAVYGKYLERVDVAGAAFDDASVRHARFLLQFAQRDSL